MKDCVGVDADIISSAASERDITHSQRVSCLPVQVLGITGGYDNALWSVEAGSLSDSSKRQSLGVEIQWRRGAIRCSAGCQFQTANRLELFNSKLSRPRFTYFSARVSLKQNNLLKATCRGTSAAKPLQPGQGCWPLMQDERFSRHILASRVRGGLDCRRRRIRPEFHSCSSPNSRRWAYTPIQSDLAQGPIAGHAPHVILTDRFVLARPTMR